MYQIIDNFLDKKFYQELCEIIKSHKIAWFFKAEDTENTLNKNGYFCHNFYNDDQPDSSYYSSYIKPILKKLNLCSILILFDWFDPVCLFSSFRKNNENSMLSNKL